MANLKITDLIVTTDPTGGFIEIDIPDGLGGYITRRISATNLAGAFYMLKSIYDPGNKEVDSFDSLNIDYDNTVSGLTSENVKDALDELLTLISSISGTLKFTIVTNLTARNAIPSGNRQEGMICYVISEEINYQLRGGITNSDWVNILHSDSEDVINGSVLLDNDTGYIVVGDITLHRTIFIQYDIIRGSIHEAGYIALTNENNTELDRTILFADSGFVFEKAISGNEIRIVYTDPVPTGQNGIFSLTLNKLLI
jgi:hypothetical protein